MKKFFCARNARAAGRFLKDSNICEGIYEHAASHCFPAPADSATRSYGVSSVRETRRSKRKPFAYVALLDFHDGELPRPCEVRDISDGGARLAVCTDTKTIPDTFELLLSPTARVQRSCKVAWRSTTELGVQFLKPSD